MTVEVIKTNSRLLENFTSIKSIKSEKKHKNIYKRIIDFLKHKTLNKQLSLRCFYEHKKHKTLFISIKSYAQDGVYEHKITKDEHKMMHTEVVCGHKMMHKMSTRCCL